MEELNKAIENTISKAQKAIEKSQTLQSKKVTPSNDVDIMVESDYNEYKNVYNNYEDNVFLDFENGIDIGKNTEFLRSAINTKYNGKPPINTKRIILWRNNAYIFNIDDKYDLKIYGVIKIEGNEEIIKFCEEVYSDVTNEINESTEEYGISAKKSRSRKGYSNRGSIDAEKRGTNRANGTIFNEGRNDDRLGSDRKSNGNIRTKLENSNQSSFSLPKTDNQGRTLTKEQQEYFKDSKVRDENGNLLTVYHGSNSDFTIFDISRVQKSMHFFILSMSIILENVLKFLKH